MHINLNSPSFFPPTQAYIDVIITVPHKLEVMRN